jgi:hypothetical protein
MITINLAMLHNLKASMCKVSHFGSIGWIFLFLFPALVVIFVEYTNFCILTRNIYVATLRTCYDKLFSQFFLFEPWSRQ